MTLEDKLAPRGPRIYVNHASVHAGPIDVAVEIGVKSAPEGTVHLDGILVMSPQMAKILAQLLTVSMQQWEAKHGELRLGGQITSAQAGPKGQPS